MRVIRSVAVAALALGLSGAAAGPVSAQPADRAQNRRGALVVDAAWLAQHLKDPDLVLLHVGDPSQYAARHLPNARFVSLDDISVSDHSGRGLMLEMRSADDLRQHLAALGISDTSRLVVYAAQEWLTPATRAIFTLDYAGLGDRTALLDGGLEAWVRAGQPVTDVVPAAKTGTLSPLTIRPLIVDAKYVREHLRDSKVAIVDGRSASFYDGVQTGGSHDGPHKTGHIAGARSIPFTEIFGERNALRSPEDLKALFTKAGVKAGDTVVGYCHIGQQTTAMLFAARTLGHPVLLYDGSFEDWSHQPEAPVDDPSKKNEP